MNKEEAYYFIDNILKEAKEDLRKYNFYLLYDLNYNCNKSNNDPLCAFLRVENNLGLLNIDFDYIYDHKDNNTWVNNSDMKYLEIIYHEIEHAYQLAYYLAFNKNKYIYQDNNYLKMNYLIEKIFYDKYGDDTLYDKYHHYYPNEHDANVMGIINSLNKLNIDEIDTLKAYLIYGYDKTYKKVYSPYEIIKNALIYNNGIDKEFKKIDKLTKKLSLYDRLRFGLNIDKDELELVNNYENDSKDLIRILKK